MATVERASLGMRMYRTDSTKVDLEEFAIVFPDDSCAKALVKRDVVVQTVDQFELNTEDDSEDDVGEGEDADTEHDGSPNSLPIYRLLANYAAKLASIESSAIVSSQESGNSFECVLTFFIVDDPYVDLAIPEALMSQLARLSIPLKVVCEF